MVRKLYKSVEEVSKHIADFPDSGIASDDGSESHIEDDSCEKSTSDSDTEDYEVYRTFPEDAGEFASCRISSVYWTIDYNCYQEKSGCQYGRCGLWRPDSFKKSNTAGIGNRTTSGRTPLSVV